MEIVRDDSEADPVNLEGLNRKAKLNGFATAIPFTVTRQTVSREKPFRVQLASGGGFVARLTKATTP